MLKIRRPQEPDEFEDAVADEKKKVKQAIQDDEKPSFSSAWGNYKAHFSIAQKGRCGYCEIPVIGGQFGDVEHYAPKSVVEELTQAGEERPGLSNVRGRKVEEKSKTGYWWLAYDWNNYLLSCAICNQQWKKALFPVVDEANRPIPPQQQGNEKPLLLHPFGRKDPIKHLEFGELGQVTPKKRSKFGRATIDVCGLDRPSLRLQRMATISDINILIHEALDAASDDILADKLSRIHRKGQHRNGAQFPGVVRSVFESKTGMAWRELEDVFGSPSEPQTE